MFAAGGTAVVDVEARPGTSPSPSALVVDEVPVVVDDAAGTAAAAPTGRVVDDVEGVATAPAARVEDEDGVALAPAARVDEDEGVAAPAAPVQLGQQQHRLR